MVSLCRAGWVVVALVALAWSGCARKAETAAPGSTAAHPKIVVQLDWFAEPEHGGFFQAEARGYFREAGLDVTLVPGGPGANVHARIATGEAQFGQSDSTNALLGVQEGLPLLAVATVFQDDPSVLMLHASNPVAGFEDLNGRTLMARPQWAFLKFIQRKYGVSFTLLPQNFGLGQFIADPGFIQQGYYIAEPYFLEKAGVKPKFLFTWDAGFVSPCVVIANREWVAAHPDTTKAFVGAFVRGWRDYLTGDPTVAHAHMRELNPKAEPAFLDYSRRMIIEEKLATGREGHTASIGMLSLERYTKQIAQLEESGLLKPDAVLAGRAASTQFLPGNSQ